MRFRAELARFLAARVASGIWQNWLENLLRKRLRLPRFARNNTPHPNPSPRIAGARDFSPSPIFKGRGLEPAPYHDTGVRGFTFARAVFHPNSHLIFALILPYPTRNPRSQKARQFCAKSHLNPNLRKTAFPPARAWYQCKGR